MKYPKRSKKVYVKLTTPTGKVLKVSGLKSKGKRIKWKTIERIK